MGRTKDCTAATIAGRTARAEQFLQAAELLDTLESEEQDLAAAFVTLGMHPGPAGRRCNARCEDVQYPNVLA